jgi:hypothetical protein
MWSGLATILAAAALTGSSSATKHGLIIGSFVNGLIYTVEFDNETLALELMGNFTVPAPSSWLGFNVSVPISRISWAI